MKYMKGTKGVVKMKDQKESKETQTENQKNTKARIITIFVCLLLTISALIGPLTPDHYYSEREKRNLTQMPIPDLEDIFSGDFAGSLEDYLTDQVPLRDRWIAVKTYAELAVGKRESGGVYIGKDHYLMDKFSTYSTKQLRINAAALADLQTAAARNHIRMQTMLVPVAAQMLTDKLPPFASAAAYETILSALQEQGVSTIDLAKVLSAHTSEDIYYRTDHHWTSLGAYYTYTAWMQVLSRQNEIIPQTEWTKETLCENFRGTTWNKVPLHGVPADSITAWYRHADRKVSYNDGQMQDTSLYTRKYLSGSDQYAVFLNSNQAETVIQGSGAAGSGKLLLIKDSYGNTFAQFPSEQFEEVRVLDLRFWRGNLMDYAKQNGITDLLVLYGTQNFVSDTVLSLFCS